MRTHTHAHGHATDTPHTVQLQCPAGVHLEMTAGGWTEEGGMLNGSLKKVRRVFAARYADVMEGVYAGL